MFDRAVRRAMRDWRYPAAVAVLMVGAAFLLASVASNVAYRDARHQLDDVQDQATCRAELAAAVATARSSVDALDGQIISTVGRTFSDALAGEIPPDRRAQLQRLFAEQLDTRDSLQTVLDDELERQTQSAALCPG